MFEDQATAASAEADALRTKVATLEAQLAAQDEHVIHFNLASCPFCQSPAQMTRRLRDGCLEGEADAWAYSVVCRGCAAVGPWAKTAAGAAQLWGGAAPWEIVGRVPTQEEIKAAAVHDTHTSMGMSACFLVLGARGPDIEWILHDEGFWPRGGFTPTTIYRPLGPDGRPMPKPSHIP